MKSLYKFSQYGSWNEKEYIVHSLYDYTNLLKEMSNIPRVMLEMDPEISLTTQPHLSGIVSPYKVAKLLEEELGFTQIKFEHSEEWTGDCWMTFRKAGYPNIVLYWCGWDFDLKLMLEED